MTGPDAERQHTIAEATLRKAAEVAEITDPLELQALPYLAQSLLSMLQMQWRMKDSGHSSVEVIKPRVMLAAYVTALDTFFPGDGDVPPAILSELCADMLAAGAMMSPDPADRPDPEDPDFNDEDLIHSTLHKAAGDLGLAASLCSQVLGDGYVAMAAEEEVDPSDTLELIMQLAMDSTAAIGKLAIDYPANGDEDGEQP